jgi:hypothetical protein
LVDQELADSPPLLPNVQRYCARCRPFRVISGYERPAQECEVGIIGARRTCRDICEDCCVYHERPGRGTSGGILGIIARGKSETSGEAPLVLACHRVGWASLYAAR